MIDLADVYDSDPPVMMRKIVSQIIGVVDKWPEDGARADLVREILTECQMDNDLAYAGRMGRT